MVTSKQRGFAVVLCAFLPSLGCHDVVSSRNLGRTSDNSDLVDDEPLDNEEPSPEICNFHDDNNDHQVDEGFEWVVSEWEPLVTTTFCAGYTRATTLSDGRVAVSGTDSFGESRDRGFVALVSPSGELLEEPIWTDIPAPGATFTSITEGPDGQIAALYDSTDYAGCAEACPAVLTRVDQDFRLFGSDTIDVPFNLAGAWDVAWAPPAYLLFLNERGAGIPHLVRVDPDTGARGSDTELPTGATFWGNLAAGQTGVGWLASGNRGAAPTPLSFGLNGSQQCPQQETDLAPTLIAEEDSAGTQSDSASRNLVHTFDNNFFATYNSLVDDTTQPQLARIKCSEIIAGPIPAGPSGTEAADIAVIEDKSVLVLSARIRTPRQLVLRRLRTDIQPMDPPADDIVIDSFNLSGTIAVTERGILVFRAGGCDTRSLDVATITCAEQ